MVKEIVTRKVEVTSSQLEGELVDILLLIKKDRRSGNLIISFNFGTEVGKKFELIKKPS